MQRGETFSRPVSLQQQQVSACNYFPLSSGCFAQSGLVLSSCRISVALSTRVVSKWPVLSVHRRGPSSLLPWKTQCASGDRPFQLEWFQHRSKSAVCSSMEYRRIDLILGLPIRSCAGLRAVSGKRGFAYRSIVVRRSGPCSSYRLLSGLFSSWCSGICLLAGFLSYAFVGGSRLLFP